MQTRTRWLVLAVAGVAGLSLYWLWPRDYCRSAERTYGLELPRCPQGELRQIVRLHGEELQRGGEGAVYVSAEALYAVATSDSVQQAVIRDFDTELSLVDASGEETPLEPEGGPEDGWHRAVEPPIDGASHRHARRASVVLPDVPDGDYRLRARVRSRVGESQVDLPLGLYVPARVHVLTDRPLYEPGNEVQFRAVVVSARDLSPLDHRPGMWTVNNPSGDVLLEEKAPAGEWGVASGSFPLDSEAATGNWTVSWSSGRDEASATFRVEPFTLPRFRVEAAAEQPFYQPGDTPALTGEVVYSSGAPVAGASLEVTWEVRGAWPPPSAWTQGALPRSATTDAAGRFALTLPEVPADLRGQVTLAARIAATDAAGDRVYGAASVRLSEDAIRVQAITELGGDGLVANANNRLYLRVTTADGRPLPGAAIHVRQAWNAADPGIDAELDANSVARIQIDPGPPVNVVIPPMPVRVQPAATATQPLVSLDSARDLVSGQPPSLADQMALERWREPLGRCAKWLAHGARTIAVSVRVTRQGTLANTLVDAGGMLAGASLERCVAGVLRGQRLPAGADRLYSLSIELDPLEMPSLSVAVEGPGSAAVQDAVTRAALDARGCLPEGDPLAGAGTAELPWVLEWRVRRGSPRVQARWIRAGDRAMPPGLAPCVLSRLGRHRLAEPAEQDGMGIARYSLDYPQKVEPPPPPEPTIMKGYELLVTAEVAGEPAGQTRLRMKPGQIPRLRLRADPVLARPGDEVTLSLIRGPSFEGELPEKLTVRHRGTSEEIDLDAETRTATFPLPADASGWYQAEAAGERALVYVRPERELAVAIAPEAPRYAPGAQATLRIRTRTGDRGVQAAVGLVGVDQTLAQLASLPGPEALASLRPAVSMRRQAFGALDAQALTMGHIRGRPAAEATILQVSHIPEPADLDVVTGGSAETAFDPVAVLTDRFYVVLAELHAQTRAWEHSAPPDETMAPATMAGLWQRAVDACAARGEDVTDAFGRRLRLHDLPPDLLALTDPRQVVVEGTRLPEDVVNWTEWVARNRP